MKEFLVKIERVTLKGEPKKKMSQRGEPYTAYSYDVEISAGDDMFLIDKFIMVKAGGTIDEAIKRENLFVGAVGMMKISSSIGEYTKEGKSYRIGRLRIESFTCYNKREEAEAQSMVDNAQAASQAAAQAAVQEQMAAAQAAQQAAQAASVAPEMPTETVMGDGSGLPF